MNSLTNSEFHNEFSGLCDALDNKSENILILGDFNVHSDATDNSLTKKICKVLESHDLKQHVSQPTHRSGHIIDWLISRDDNLINDVHVEDRQMSDHFLVTCHLNLNRPILHRKEVLIGNIKNIDIAKFNRDLEGSALLLDPPEDVNDLANLFSDTLSGLLNKRAPVKAEKVRPKDVAHGDQAERRWRIHVTHLQIVFSSSHQT